MNSNADFLDNYQDLLISLFIGPLALGGMFFIWRTVGQWAFARELSTLAQADTDPSRTYPAVFHRWKRIHFWVTILLFAFSLGMYSLIEQFSVRSYFMAGMTTFFAAGVLVLTHQRLAIFVIRLGIDRLLARLLKEHRALEMDRVLVGLTFFQDVKVQRLALDTMEAWGSPRSVRFFQDFLAIMPRPYLAHFFQTSGMRMAYDLDHARQDDLDGISKLIGHSLFWRKLAEVYDQGKSEPILQRMEMAAGDYPELLGFFRKNKVLVDTYPQVYDLESRKRARMVELDALQVVTGADGQLKQGLIAGVKEVVGQIGGQEAWKLEGDKATLQLWNQEERRVDLAEVDTVEILESADDFGVVSVLEKLVNQGQGDGFKVVVRGRPALQDNTFRIINAYP